MVSLDELKKRKSSVAIIGMGYVGLPLAVELGKKLDVIGFDISKEKVDLLERGIDPSKELTCEELKSTTIRYTSDSRELKKAGFIIVAVPTPIDSANNPDLSPIKKACKTIGENLTKGTCVVLESTVYPGVTEEVMGQELERVSGLVRGVDFKLGYSPERINPGDKEHILTKIVKVVSGEDSETLDLVAGVYSFIIEAGVHRAESIQVAEAAKVIENTQRDLNIALMNELSLIFDKLGIDTFEVLRAAGTKWNFLKFFPGLVGGHCIGVDPYYLTHKAKEIGYNAEIILAGRKINDFMGKHVAEKTVKAIIKRGDVVRGAKVLIMGMTFKENVSDIRNTKVTDIINELKSYEVDVVITDPYASNEEAMQEYGVELTNIEDVCDVTAVILATPHDKYADLTPDFFKEKHKHPASTIVMDIKRILPKLEYEKAGIYYYGL